jgi:hypothetical protein
MYHSIFSRLHNNVIFFRWYALKGKAGSKKPDKDRGELEVTSTFLVQNTSSSQLSLNVSSKTKKSLSFRNLAHTVGKFCPKLGT